MERKTLIAFVIIQLILVSSFIAIATNENDEIPQKQNNAVSLKDCNDCSNSCIDSINDNCGSCVTTCAQSETQYQNKENNCKETCNGSNTCKQNQNSGTCRTSSSCSGGCSG